MFFLNATDPDAIKAARAAMVGVGYRRSALRMICCESSRRLRPASASHRRQPELKAQVIHFVNKKMRPACQQDARALLMSKTRVMFRSFATRRHQRRL